MRGAVVGVAVWRDCVLGARSVLGAGCGGVGKVHVVRWVGVVEGGVLMLAVQTSGFSPFCVEWAQQWGASQWAWHEMAGSGLTARGQ